MRISRYSLGLVCAVVLLPGCSKEDPQGHMDPHGTATSQPAGHAREPLPAALLQDASDSPVTQAITGIEQALERKDLPAAQAYTGPWRSKGPALEPGCCSAAAWSRATCCRTRRKSATPRGSPTAWRHRTGQQVWVACTACCRGGRPSCGCTRWGTFWRPMGLRGRRGGRRWGRFWHQRRRAAPRYRRWRRRWPGWAEGLLRRAGRRWIAWNS